MSLVQLIAEGAGPDPGTAPGTQPGEGVGLREFLRSIPDETSREAVAWLDPQRHLIRSIFPNTSGRAGRRDIKRRFRMLYSIQARLDRLLQAHEQIVFVTRGVQHSALDQCFMGAMSLIVNRSIFVLTSCRLLVFNAHGHGEAGRMAWQVPYDRITKVRVPPLMGLITLRLTGGGSVTLRGVPRGDRRLVRGYFDRLVERARGDTTRVPAFTGRDPLCPACATAVPWRTGSCPKCRERFLSPRSAALLSTMVPGLGDLYLGHRLMAGLVLLCTVVAWMWCSTTLARAGSIEGADLLPSLALLLLFFHCGHGLLTWRVARKGVVRRTDAWCATSSLGRSPPRPVEAPAGVRRAWRC